jgi:DNA-binding transcriptional LysR family regulator
MFSFRTDSNLAQLAAIRAGFGIGFCQVALAGDTLVRVLAREVAIDLDTFIVMHEDLRDSRRCRVVFDALAEGLTRHLARQDL